MDSKDSEEWKAEWHWDACLLVTNFGKWKDQKISEGHLQWDEHDKNTYDDTDPCKEAKCPNQLGPPLDYMPSCRVFKPKKTSEYDLCHFYQVGLSGDLPEFPLPCTPATHKQVSSFLLKARVLGWLNLIVAHSQDAPTAVCLLQELHIKDSLCHLPMDTKVKAGSKSNQKLSCQYSGSNDQSYMNHIICGHYNANYGCSKCLNEVFITGQTLRKHMKTYKGLPKEAMDKATAEDTDSTTSGKKKKSKSKDLPPDSQPPSQSSQGSSQASPCCSQCTKKKAATTLQKSDSHKKKKHSSSHKHHGKSSKDKDKPSECCRTKSSGTSKGKCSETRKEKSSNRCETKSSGTSKDKSAKKSKDKSGKKK